MSSNIFDKYSANYMGGNKKLENYHQYRINSFLNIINKHFKHYDSAIDYGCGDGIFKKHLKFDNYVGIDPSEEMIRLARLSFPNSYEQFIKGGLEELEKNCKNENTQNRILICLNTLPYMSEEEIDKFFTIASKYQMPIITSHTNELLDLVTFNRYTIEHRQSLISDKKFDDFHSQFEKMLSDPKSPAKATQIEARFGTNTINTSERDTIKKNRVDPFSWPDFISKKYNYEIIMIQPIRIFAFPPKILEKDETTISLLHSNQFDYLPETYKKIFCSQFQIAFTPK